MATQMPPVAQFSLPTPNAQPQSNSVPSAATPKGMPPVAQFSLPQSAQQSQNTTSPDASSYIPPEFRVGTANAPTQQEGQDYLTGTAKGILSTLQGGNVLDTMNKMAGQPTLKDITGVDPNQASAPSNPAQQTGALMSEVAAGLIGGGEGKAMIKPTEEGLLSKSIQDVMPLQNKATRIDELRNTLPTSAPGTGGISRTGLLGSSVAQSSAQDIERGTAANPFIKGVKDPVKQIANINQGIIDSSKETNAFLDAKKAPTNFSDMIDYMETNRPTSNLQKDPQASEAYERATQNALDTLYNTMKSSAKETGDFGPNTSGADIRTARISIDQQISKELGENVFGSPQYKGIKAAEIDTRNLLNRMTEDMLRYPGQMENLNKMNSFISQSGARGIEVDMENPAVRSQLEDAFGLNPSGESDAEILASKHSQMSHLYDARDNLIDKYQSSVGKNRVQEAVANNPLVKTIVETGKKAIPFGLGSHL